MGLTLRYTTHLKFFVNTSISSDCIRIEVDWQGFNLKIGEAIKALVTVPLITLITTLYMKTRVNFNVKSSKFPKKYFFKDYQIKM